MKEITIPLSKTKIVFWFLVSVGFVVLGFWFISIAEDQTKYNPLLLTIFSFVDIVFFGLCGVYIFAKFFDKSHGLVINNQGIIDNSSAVSVGLIKWENITNVVMIKVGSQNFLTIEVNNVDEILAKQHGFKKIVMNLNKSFYSSPVQISASALKCNFSNLYELIKEQLSLRRII